MDSWFHLQESLQDTSAALETERGHEPSAVEWQHLEVLEALEAEQRPWGHRVVTTLSRLRGRLDGADPAPAALAVTTGAVEAVQPDENAA